MERYKIKGNNCRCHPETCCCDPYLVVDTQKNDERVASFYKLPDAENLLKHLNPPPQPKKAVLVWKTREGDQVRLTHMSSEHLVNAIDWLLHEQNLDPEWKGDNWSDLTERYEGVMLGTWIKAMTEELYSRIG